MPTQLVVVAGPDLGRAFPVPDRTTFAIGRGAQSHTRLVDLSVSRIHCELRLDEGRATVTDAKSASGTLVNGRPITSHELRPGDIIKIGNTELRYENDIADQKTLPPTPVVPTTPKTKAAVGVTRAESVRPPAPPPPLAAPAPPAREIIFANRPGARILPSPLKDLHEMVGKPLGGYELLSVLGTGQVGVVYKALDTKDQKTVALKVLRADFAKDQKAMQRFVRGMMTVRNLTHPNLIELYNAGITGAHCWIAMEFVDGGSVAQLMQAGTAAGKRDWSRAFAVAVHISRALGFMHQRGLIHRNVLPQNIVVRKSDQVAKLGDAMLAKALEGTSAQDVTASGELVGNIFYLAPERTMRGVDADGRTDLYSLGVTVYTLLAGKLPFEGVSMPEVITKIRTAVPSRLTDFDPAIPAAFDAIVHKMLAKRPDDRYPSAEALLVELEKVAKAHG
jgi:hypothetical protein